MPVAYDPLIAKLIAQDATREEALDRLSGGLDETRVGGVTTNLPSCAGSSTTPRYAPAARPRPSSLEHPPLSRRRATSYPWRCYWRANRDPAAPPPPPAPPPVLEARPHAHDGGIERSVLKAPMPGTVIRVLAAEGDLVEPRQPLVVLEAMKMETPIVSPYEAVVERVHVVEGDQVVAGAILVELEE